MEINTKLRFLTAIYVIYGLMLMGATFTYYNQLQDVQDTTKVQCKLIEEETRGKFDLHEGEEFCKKIGTWITCSMVAFIAGLLIVSSTIYFYTKIATQASHNSISSRDPEKTYFFYIVLLIVVAAMSTIMSIILIDSKAITAHTGTNIPKSVQLVAIVNIALLFLPLLLLIVATVVASAVLPLWSFIFSSRTRARDFTQVPMTNNSCDTFA